MIKSKLWIVDDEESIREICKSALEDSFFIETFPNGSEALLALNSDKPDLIITDIKMPGLSGLDLLQKVSEKYPGLPTIVITAHSDIDNALSAYKGGAFEYLPKPFDVDKIRSLALKALNQSDSAITPKKSKTMQPPKIIGQAQSLQNLFRAIGKISNSDITVLIRGESGTGKELIAQAVHDNSKRNVEPFVAINVAAIPHDLLESELFGHEKGAFTGAQAQRIGRFEQAQGGTLFLDEIGDMHPELQTRLLRVLSSQEFYRVGGHRPIKSDVRIIAATNQSIEDLIKIGKFREDLYHRLNVFKLVLPPLRERKEDIASLITYFLKTYAAELNTEEKRIDDITLQYLVGFNWPGNIRQLENICRYLTVMSASSVITIDDLPDDIFKNNQEVDISKASGNWKSDLQQHIRGEIPSDKDILKKIGVEVEKILIEESLIATDGIKSEAAKLLGWGRNTLARKAKKTK
ncbi:MAG: two-component system nitrogen regulation response regulator GlnG [Gammaproteobacteria bacterium]|jgi:two-component system nitrogen regulation response regulator GlnG|tara:strand:+ start:1407 stop:2798 length:1392 start_codon:yes stop_codon:yes gene_type:complete